jgi:hypothetical protein
MGRLALYPQLLNLPLAASASASGVASPPKIRKGTSHLPFGLALTAVTLQLTLSGNSLNDLGFHYSLAGGNPIFKFHPATYLTFCAAIIALLSHPRGKLLNFLGQRPGLTAFLLITALASLWSVLNVGFTGSAVYVETYLSAGALAIVLDMADPAQKRLLARAMIWFLVINVGIALYEALIQEHLIPIYYSEKDRAKELNPVDAEEGEFRGAALYTHPLAGALFTAMGIFLVLALDLSFAWAALLFGILAIGLLAFGGRAALFITGGLLLVKGSMMTLHDLASRRWNPRLIGAVTLTWVVLVPVGAIVVTETPIGDRIVSRLYYDDSAEVRSSQWLVFEKLDRADWMYGVPVEKQEALIANARAGAIENPLILMFLSLGAPVLVIFLFGFGAYLVYLGGACPQGRWLLCASLLIISTSNSIGTKCSDLFIMTACLFAIGKPTLEAARARSRANLNSNRARSRSEKANGQLSTTPQFRVRHMGLTPEPRFQRIASEPPF